MNGPISVALRSSDVELEYIGANGVECLLDKLSSLEQLLASLCGLANRFVRRPALALSVLAAVESRGTNTVNFDISATCARRVCGLTADHAYTARFVFHSGHA